MGALRALYVVYEALYETLGLGKLRNILTVACKLHVILGLNFHSYQK